MNKKNIKIWLIFFFLFASSSVLVYRLYSLQIKKGDYYEALALGQQISFDEIAGERGNIFFSNKEPLAKTVKKYLVYIFPDKLQKNEKEKLSVFLYNKNGNLSKEQIDKKMKRGETIRLKLSKEEFLDIKKENMKGAQTDEIWGRVYPEETLASHIAGFLNEEKKGQYGVEGFYDDYLRGIKLLKKKSKSPFGYLVGLIKNDSSSARGADIYLSIEKNIQHQAEKLLREAEENWDIDSGEIIVYNPKTGKIISLAIYPNFNPNNYSGEKDLSVFMNPAVQFLFEPGSVFKPFVMAGGLEEKLITPTTTYEDIGSVDVGGVPIYNYGKRIWGEQSMTDVLEESINTGAVFVEEKLGKNMFLNYLEKFGFFRKTEIELQGEVSSQNKGLKSGYQRDISSASFGQGVQITPIQLIRAFGSIANNGIIMKPSIIEKITREEKEELFRPQEEGRVLSEQTAKELVEMLISVVENGSGWRAALPGYHIAAKTGTAQVPKETGGYYENRTIQSIIGFLPARNPKILIFVRLDNPKNALTSGISTAPIFKEMAKYIVNYLEIPPSYPLKSEQ